MKSLAELKKIREEAASRINLRDKKDGFRIVVGMATCGITAGARPVLAAFVDQVAAKNLNNVTVTQVGCLGECALEPVVEVFDAQGNRTTYAKVSVADVEVILDKHVIGGNVVTEKTLDVIKAAK
jgi:NADP-reducing hydrogenase subunit HndB